jgi:parallel beta-helix repeat protein
MAGVKVFAVAVLAAAVPLVPGLPDLNPEGSPSPPPSQPPAEERKPPPSDPGPQPPSADAERVCDRMAAPWGHDRASGEPREPYRSPGRLATSLRPGETGCLRGGTYVQREVRIRRRKITLRSAPGERALWRGRIVLEGRRQKLVDLALDGAAGPKGLPSPTVNAPEVVISDSDVTHSRGICIMVRTWGGDRPDGFVIQRNRIHDCGRRPPTNHDHGIYVADAVGGLIRDNVIFRNADRGVQLYPDAHRVTVVRNTIDGNGSGVIFSNESSRNVVRENLISNSVVRWNAESHNLSGSGNRFESNCVRPGHEDPDYHENGGIMLPSLVAQRDNKVVTGEMYRARADGDYTPVESGCGKRGAHGPARKPR